MRQLVLQARRRADAPRHVRRPRSVSPTPRSLASAAAPTASASVWQTARATVLASAARPIRLAALVQLRRISARSSRVSVTAVRRKPASAATAATGRSSAIPTRALDGSVAHAPALSLARVVPREPAAVQARQAAAVHPERVVPRDHPERADRLACPPAEAPDRPPQADPVAATSAAQPVLLASADQRVVSQMPATSASPASRAHVPAVRIRMAASGSAATTVSGEHVIAP